MRGVLGVLLLGSLACTPIQVVTGRDPDADFSRFASYVQVPPPAESPALANYSAALGERIQREIGSILDAKGYRPAPPGQGDLRVAFHVNDASRERLVAAADPDANYQVREPYIEGTLEIEVVDAHHSRRVWHGRGQTVILTSGRLVRDNVESVTLREVRAILKKFPEAAQD